MCSHSQRNRHKIDYNYNCLPDFSKRSCQQQGSYNFKEKDKVLLSFFLKKVSTKTLSSSLTMSINFNIIFYFPDSFDFAFLWCRTSTQRREEKKVVILNFGKQTWACILSSQFKKKGVRYRLIQTTMKFWLAGSNILNRSAVLCLTKSAVV